MQVALEHEGIAGYGEGAPVDYWGETTASLAAFVETEAAALVGADPFALEAIGDRLREVVAAGAQDGARRARSTTGSASASATPSGGCSG